MIIIDVNEGLYLHIYSYWLSILDSSCLILKISTASFPYPLNLSPEFSPHSLRTLKSPSLLLPQSLGSRKPLRSYLVNAFPGWVWAEEDEHLGSGRCSLHGSTHSPWCRRLLPNVPHSSEQGSGSCVLPLVLSQKSDLVVL